MIKRNESESPSKKRQKKKNARKKNRRMMMEDLESRRLLTTVPNFDVPDFQGPRNPGTVASFQYIEQEATATLGVNDSFVSAELVPLGNLPGQQDTVDISGSAAFQVRNPPITLLDGTIIPATFDADVDFYRFELRRGDIFDIATTGTVTEFTVYNGDGTLWFGVNDNQALTSYPPTSPLQTQGNAVFAQVVPEDGTYYIGVAPSDVTTTYTLNLRTYRPVVEQLPIGAQQYVFVDFDGGLFPTSILDDGTGIPQFGVVRYPSLRESLPLIGVQELDVNSMNQFIDMSLQALEEKFEFLALNGNAGNFDATGVGGEFGITFLNSRDHADPGPNELVTRLMVGGVAPIPALGVSTTIDIGNFGMDDVVFTYLDGLQGAATSVPIANTRSVLNAIADFAGAVMGHEIAHSFGVRHTEPGNLISSLGDGPPTNAEALGVGNDGIYGTLDDVELNFQDDIFSVAEGLVGTSRVVNGLSNTLVTGTLGGSVVGRVFNDLNGNGVADNDPGLANVTVFVDLDGDGIFDPGEPTSQSDENGNYTLSGPPGTFNVIAVAPSQFAGSTILSQSVSFSTSTAAVAADFGFTQTTPDISGMKFADLNGNGALDDGEPGIGDVFIFLDLDGDERPDLGEPATRTNADGSFSLNSTGVTGTFGLREVVEPGFQQTLPGAASNFEYLVTLNGTALPGNFNFGNQPTLDFGDAPDTYLTSTTAGGPSHGIVAGLSLGTVVDREVEAAFSDDATGDDVNGAISPITGLVTDDEDGVVLSSPLGVGATTNLSVTVTNTTGSTGFLNAWMDFDGSGTFDAGEQFTIDLPLATGTHDVAVAVPDTAVVGTTIARFRYSHTAGLGPAGTAETGEVEDHAFTISPSTNIVNNDTFNIPRNSTPQILDVLANDFQGGAGLTIVRLIQAGDSSLGISPTQGQLTTGQNNDNVIYTPPTGFVGRDEFGYVVEDASGTEFTGIVTVNVSFETAVPIAVDDIFEVPAGSSNRPLNVLDNDVTSIAGGLSIAAVNPGTQGGTLSPIGGNQSIEYTPRPGFSGTEQFTYSIVDGNGQFSTATVTVNVLPGSQLDDVVEFTIDILDPLNGTSITNVQAGEFFDVRVNVQDLDTNDPRGVASAFLDLLYTSELVAVVPSDTAPGGIQISFGEKFGTGFVDIPSEDLLLPSQPLSSGQVPGLINEVGAFQTSNPSMTHDEPEELFTVRMQALSPGIAVFQGDPANTDFAQTIVVQDNVGNTAISPVNELRFGSAELVIGAPDGAFTSAVDDSFPSGVQATNRLNVLSNDNIVGTLVDHGIVVAPSFGTLVDFGTNEFFNDNGTPDDLTDDFITYNVNVNESDLDQFTYFIQTLDPVTGNNVTSFATVSLAVGNAASDDRVLLDFALVDTAGNTISSVEAGQPFGVQLYGEDLQNTNPVFSAYLDVLYDSDLIRPRNTIVGDNLDFDATIASSFNAAAATGSAARPGILDEFGTIVATTSNSPVDLNNPTRALIATIFFDALAPGTTTVVGDPADNIDQSETTLLDINEVIPVSQIRYTSLPITIIGAQGEFRQNVANPEDVDNSGTITPFDALLTLNAMTEELNQSSLRSALGESAPSTAQQFFVDVSGDGLLSPFDALLVLNKLHDMEKASRNLAFAEQVSIAPIDRGTAGDSIEDVADVVLTDLNESQLTVDFPSENDSTTTPLEVADVAIADDDEDVLDLLASDLSGLV